MSEYYVDLEPMSPGLVANATSGALRSLRAVQADMALGVQSFSRRVALTMRRWWADSETEMRVKQVFAAAIPALFAVIGVYNRRMRFLLAHQLCYACDDDMARQLSCLMSGVPVMMRQE
jgi:hypothetical protein